MESHQNSFLGRGKRKDEEVAATMITSSVRPCITQSMPNLLRIMEEEEGFKHHLAPEEEERHQRRVSHFRGLKEREREREKKRHPRSISHFFGDRIEWDPLKRLYGCCYIVTIDKSEKWRDGGIDIEYVLLFHVSMALEGLPGQETVVKMCLAIDFVFFNGFLAFCVCDDNNVLWRP